MNYIDIYLSDDILMSHECKIESKDVVIDADVKMWLTENEYINLVLRSSAFEKQYNSDFDTLRREVMNDIRNNASELLVAYAVITRKIGEENEPKQASILIDHINEVGKIVPLNVTVPEDEQKEIINQVNEYALNSQKKSLDEMFSEYEDGLISSVKDEKDWTQVFSDLIDALEYCVMFTTDALNTDMANDIREVAEETWNYVTDEEIIDDSKYIMFDRYKRNIESLSFVCNAEYVVEVLENEIYDFVEKDLRNELADYGIKAPEIDCPYQKFVELGEALKEGTPKERYFYGAHQWDFKTIDLIVNHIEEVDVDKVAEREMPKEIENDKQHNFER